mgnify:CR=1 FL=1
MIPYGLVEACCFEVRNRADEDRAGGILSGGVRGLSRRIRREAARGPPSAGAFDRAGGARLDRSGL